MTRSVCRWQSLAFAVLIGAIASPLVPRDALAQTQASEDLAPAPPVSEVVVTGSHIRQSPSETVAPVTFISPESLADQGYVQAGDALNTITTNAPKFTSTIGSGPAAGNGQDYPNLFNLGAGRTLTLVDGIRMTSTQSGLGDRTVNTNIIPIGLLDRIDVVQASGAAVYGSDAIAGVINYVMKKNFEGLVFDGQAGESTYGDLPKYSTRLTFGQNFNDKKGNVAVDFEWNKTGSLLFTDREYAENTVRYLTNPYNTGAAAGTLPATIGVPDPHFWSGNYNGVLFTSSNSQSMNNLLGFSNPSSLSGYQFSSDGKSISAYNPGAQYAPPNICSFPFCIGGDGYPYSNIAALASGVENMTATAIGHYDVTEHLTISAQFLYSRNVGTDPYGSQEPSDTFAFTKNNPFLSPSAIANLSAISQTFASGGPLYLSKYYPDLLPTREWDYVTNSVRGVIGANGDFDFLDRNFYYGVTYSISDVRNNSNALSASTTRLTNAENAVLDGTGQPACAVNVPVTIDPGCAPIDAFGTGNVSQAARNYLVFPTNTAGDNSEDDLVATLGGEFLLLPAGRMKFSLGYEHRTDTALSVPSIALQQGLINGSVSPTSYGSFNTNEYFGELLLPIIGKSFNLGQTVIEKMDINGQFRRVDNSIAGSEDVWGFGGSVQTAGGFTFRADRSRNFRAPTLTELLSPVIVAPGGGVQDPCDGRVLKSGTNPAVREANCVALFEANPTFGLQSINSLPAGSSAAARLANFQDPSYNSSTDVMLASGGNPNLQNEVAFNRTYGVSWMPPFVPGHLNIGYDHIAIDIRNGLTEFTPTNFAQSCFDSTSMPANVCSTFMRDPTTGYIVTATDTTFNAASVRYRGDLYKLDYGFPMSWLAPGGRDIGTLDIDIEATHNRALTTIVAGVVTQQAGTTLDPWWVVRADVHYAFRALRLNYELYYMPGSKINSYDTPLSTATPYIDANARHNVSASYELVGGKYQVRAGIVNLTNTQPSFPTFNYGDPYGRQFFVGFTGKFF